MFVFERIFLVGIESGLTPRPETIIFKTRR